MNGNTLKAAVTRFMPLFNEGKSEAEIKEAIAAGYDDKKFVDSEVQEIFAAITTAAEPDSVSISAADFALFNSLKAEKELQLKAEEEKSNQPAKFIVTKEFRSRDNFALVYQVGDDVSDFSLERLESMLANGLVEKV